MSEFSKSSQTNLDGCHPDIQKVMNIAIRTCPIDFGISQGYRTVERQQELYRKGRDENGNIIDQSKVVTYIDGVNKLSSHNVFPSNAVDIYAYVNGKASYEQRHLAFLGGYIMAVANQLLSTGVIDNAFRWGGNWDGDGEIITDQRFIDLPHFEII